MASKQYLTAVKYVSGLANKGFRLSELHGLRKSVAERLIDRGRLTATRLPNGDFLVTK